MQCSRTIASYGDTRGHSHGMERFTRPYSVELTPEQYSLLCEEECLTLRPQDIKFVDPENICKIKLITFYVPVEEKAERERVDLEKEREWMLKEEKKNQEKRAWLLELEKVPKKTGPDSWCFIKAYDPTVDDLVVILFGNYQVFRDVCDGQKGYRFVQQNYPEEVQERYEVFMTENLVTPGYGDFDSVTPDKIQEKPV